MAENKRYCEPCMYIQEKEEANGFCLTCAEYLCNDCLKEHRKGKLTRQHLLMHNGVSDNAEVFRALRDLTICRGHAEMKITHYCPAHDDYICSLCCLETHSTCEKVQDLINTEQPNTEGRDIITKFQVLSDLAGECLAKTEKAKDCLHDDRTFILEEKKQEVEKAIARLKELDKESTELLEHLFASALSDTEGSIRYIQRIQESCLQYQNVLHAAQESGDNTTSKIVTKLLSSKLTTLQEKIKGHENKQYQRLHFQKILCFSELYSIGSISVKGGQNATEDVQEVRIEKSSDEIVEEGSEKSTQNEPKTHSFEASLQSNPILYNIRTASDKSTCNVDGIIATNEYVVLIDRNNLNLKVLSNDFDVLHTLKLPGRPLRICQIGENAFAVGFINVKRINTYDINDNARAVYTGGFNTKLFNSGLAFNGKHIVALMSDVEFPNYNKSTTDVIELQILDQITGFILYKTRKFRACGPNKQLINLTSTQTIALTKENDLIVAEANRLMCFCIEIKDAQMTAQEKLYCVAGHHIPRDDIINVAAYCETVYVCTESGKILQLSGRNFAELNVIYDSGDSLSSIQVDMKRQRLLVGMFENDSILVFGSQGKFP